MADSLESLQLLLNDRLAGADRDHARALIAEVRQEQERAASESRYAESRHRTLSRLLERVSDDFETKNAQVTQAAEEIARQRSVLETVIDALPSLVYLIGADGRVVAANRATLGMMGADSADAVVGVPIVDVMERGAAIWDWTQRILRTEEPVLDLEHPHLLNPGIHMSTSRIPYRGASGEIEGVVFVSRDVTAQRSAERTLEQQKASLEAQRAMLQTIIDAIPSMVFLIDTDQNIVTANRTTFHATGGMDVGEVIQRRLSDVLPNRADGIWEEAREVIESGEAVIDREQVDSVAPYRTLSVSRIPYRDANGEVQGVVFVARDISGEKKAQLQLVQQAASLVEQTASLESQRAMLQTIIDAIPALVVLIDKDQRIITANQATLDTMNGVSASDVEGHLLRDMIPDRADAVWEDAVEVLMSGEAILDQERVHPVNAARIVSVSRIPYRGASGEIEGVVFLTRDITEEKSAQHQLVQQAASLVEQTSSLESQRALLQTIIDAIPFHIFAIGADRRVNAANQVSLEAVGLAAVSDVVGKTLDETAPALVDVLWPDVEDVIRSGEPILEREQPRIEDPGRTMSVSCIPFRGGGGRVDGVVFVTRDVTDQKEIERRLVAQARLVESQRSLLQAVIDAVPYTIYAVGLDGIIVAANHAVVETAGATSADEVVGLSLVEAAGPLGVSLWEEVRHVLRTGVPLMDKEEPHLTMPGGVIASSRIPFYTASGEVSGVLSVVRDITEQKAAEAALRENEALIQSILDAAPDAVITVDAHDRVVAANPAVERSFGFSPSALIGTVFSDSLLPKEQREEHRAKLRDYVERGTTGSLGQVLELSACHADGTQVPAEVSVRPVAEVGGRQLFVIYMSDLSEQKQNEAALVQAKEAAEASVRAKSEFLANMSHEIRTPMNGVIGMTTLLQQSPLDADQADSVETIRTSGEALLTIINDILDFSKIEAGKLDVEDAPFDVYKTTREAADLLRHEASEKDVSLEVHLDAALPRYLSGDATRLRQILVNLLSNAVKFTPHGRVTLSAAADVRGDEAALRIAVTDTGIGIPTEKLDAIFESFSQADASTTRRYGGTGLGLTISQRLATLMGGTLTAQSTLGQGSTFELTVQTRLAEAPTVPFESVVPAASAVDPASVRLLLAEDNLINRKVALRLLDRMGYVADVAVNGREVLSAVRAAHNVGSPYDAILMDVQMPEMDGLEATRRIRADADLSSQPRIIALTANAMEGDRATCLAAGADDYLPKPVHFDDLARSLARIR